MDAIQILLIIILIISTFFLSIIGVQLFITLREMQKTMKQINKIVDNFETLGVGLNQGMQEVVGFMNGFKVVMRAIQIMQQKKE